MKIQNSRARFGRRQDEDIIPLYDLHDPGRLIMHWNTARMVYSGCHKDVKGGVDRSGTP